MIATQQFTGRCQIAVIWVLTVGLFCAAPMAIAKSDDTRRTEEVAIQSAAMGQVGAAIQASKMRKDVVLADVVAELINWIGEHTHYDISPTLADPPYVSFSDAGQEILYEGRHFVLGSSFRAVYDVETRIIYLLRPWSFSNIFDKSTLLHELVHDVQYQNRTWSCAGKSEWQAYKLQEAWLSERGVESGFNWVQILIQSRCPHDVHP